MLIKSLKVEISFSRIIRIQLVHEPNSSVVHSKSGLSAKRNKRAGTDNHHMYVHTYSYKITSFITETSTVREVRHFDQIELVSLCYLPLNYSNTSWWHIFVIHKQHIEELTGIVWLTSVGKLKQSQSQQYRYIPFRSHPRNALVDFVLFTVWWPKYYWTLCKGQYVNCQIQWHSNRNHGNWLITTSC